MEAIDGRTFARILKARAAAGYDAAPLGGHSLKRGAMTTGMDLGVHPAQLIRTLRAPKELRHHGCDLSGRAVNRVLIGGWRRCHEAMHSG
jgi:hypothetical protein